MPTIYGTEKLARQAHALSLAPDVAAVACDHYQFRGDGEVTLPSLIASRRARYEPWNRSVWRAMSNDWIEWVCG